MTDFPTQPSPPGATPAAEPAFDWREVAALFLGSRLLVWLVGGLSLTVVAKGPHYTPPAGIADWFLRWDAGYYLDIARRGYYLNAAAHATDVGFFPLYPMLVRVATLGGLVNLKLAGYLVSWVSLWVACVWLWRAAAREWRDARLATLAVAFLLFGPVSFFFSTVYSESLFLALSIGCLDSARRDRWWRAGLLGALAALTRSIGVVLVVPLLWQWLETARGRGSRPRAASTLAACLLPVAGCLVYAAYMGARFGDPLIYLHTQDHYWGRHFAWFYLLLYRESFSLQPVFYQFWFASTLAVAFGLLVAGVGLRIPLLYSIFGLGLAVIYISSRFVEGLPRYFSVVFPLYFVLGRIGRRWPRVVLPLLATSAALLALSVVLFVNGYWFT